MNTLVYSANKVCSGLALTFIVITLFFYGSVVSGIGCAYLDISPKYSSLLNTIGNTLGALAGIAGPIVVSFCVTAFGDTWGWRIVFLLTFFQCVITLLVWHLFQTSKLIDVLM
jgi:MFS family permease